MRAGSSLGDREHDDTEHDDNANHDDSVSCCELSHHILVVVTQW
jgi:hypothetical protein